MPADLGGGETPQEPVNGSFPFNQCGTRLGEPTRYTVKRFPPVLSPSAVNHSSVTEARPAVCLVVGSCSSPKRLYPTIHSHQPSCNKDLSASQ